MCNLLLFWDQKRQFLAVPDQWFKIRPDLVKGSWHLSRIFGLSVRFCDLCLAGTRFACGYYITRLTPNTDFHRETSKFASLETFLILNAQPGANPMTLRFVYCGQHSEEYGAVKLIFFCRILPRVLCTEFRKI